MITKPLKEGTNEMKEINVGARDGKRKKKHPKMHTEIGVAWRGAARTVWSRSEIAEYRPNNDK